MRLFEKSRKGDYFSGITLLHSINGVLEKHNDVTMRFYSTTQYREAI
jgi:hypothetical protein